MPQELALARVRFLPAARVPRGLRRRIEPALDQLLGLLRALPPSVEIERACRDLDFVRFELRRHGGRRGECCILTKEAVFQLSGELEDASRMLSKAGLHAAALVPAAVDDLLLALVAELQPAAPA